MRNIGLLIMALKGPGSMTRYVRRAEDIERAFQLLAPREQKMLELRFGLVDGRSRTYSEMGDEMRVTSERCRQIEAKALRKLRDPSMLGPALRPSSIVIPDYGSQRFEEYHAAVKAAERELLWALAATRPRQNEAPSPASRGEAGVLAGKEVQGESKGHP